MIWRLQLLFSVILMKLGRMIMNNFKSIIGYGFHNIGMHHAIQAGIKRIRYEKKLKEKQKNKK